MRRSRLLPSKSTPKKTASPPNTGAGPPPLCANPLVGGVVVARVVGTGVVETAALTITVPCMSAWKRQWYANVPGVLNAIPALVAPLAMAPVSQPPLSAVAVCANAVAFIQVKYGAKP